MLDSTGLVARGASRNDESKSRVGTEMRVGSSGASRGASAVAVGLSGLGMGLAVFVGAAGAGGELPQAPRSGPKAVSVTQAAVVPKNPPRRVRMSPPTRSKRHWLHVVQGVVDSAIPGMDRDRNPSVRSIWRRNWTKCGDECSSHKKLCCFLVMIVRSFLQRRIF